MNRARAIRFLRIGWSVVFGILCLLLIGLWVRSYWRVDHLGANLGHAFFVQSTEGRMGLFSIPHGNARWQVESYDRASDLSRYQTDSYWEFDKAATGSWHVIIPTGFPVLLSASLAIIPWIRWSKRFSLFTLLIAMTVVAVVLGLIVYFSAKPPATPPIDHVDVPEF